MDIRDRIMRTLNDRDAAHTTGAGALGEWIADDLETIGVIVDPDDVADRIRRIDGRHDMTTADLADALAEDIEADQDDEDDD